MKQISIIHQSSEIHQGQKYWMPLVITSFCPVTTNRVTTYLHASTLFVVTEQNVVISTNMIATALTSVAKM